LVKVSFDGFEQEELLVPVVVFADGEVLEAKIGAALLGGTFRETERETASSVSDEVLDDATEEILFNVQSSVDEAEQLRFERASLQAENYVEDRLLVLKKRRTSLQERLDYALQRRDGATGSEARTEAERTVLSVQTALEEVDAAVQRLEQRDDATFLKYREHIRRRRYAQPRTERLFEIELVIE